MINRYFGVIVVLQLLTIMRLFAGGAPRNNAGITVLSAVDNKPLAYAIVKTGPLSADSKVKAEMGLADNNGLYSFYFSAPVIIQISNVGYATIRDTLYNAQQKVYRLVLISKDISDVVITGQYRESETQQSMLPVKVITADMLREKGANNLRDALQNELGIDIGQDQFFGSYFSINGISGEGIKIMIDYVPLVGRLDGKLDLSEIDLDNVERIEIIEGPESVMYGTDAMGGVVNIITKNYKAKKMNISLRMYYESVGQYNISMNGGFNFKRNQISFDAGRNFFNGYSAVDTPRYKEWLPQEQYFASAKYIYHGDKFRITVQGSFFRELMIDRSAPVEGPVLSDSTITSWTYYGYDLHYLTYRANASAALMYTFKQDRQLDVLLGYSGFFRYINEYQKNLVTGQEEIIPDPSDQDTTTYHQFLLRATYGIEAWKNRLKFLLGTDLNQEYTSDNTITGEKQQMGDYAVFGSARVTVVEGFDIQPAVRVSYNTRFGTPVIPSIQFKYNYKDKLLLRASYGRGYRAPTLNELYLHFFDVNHALEGNPALKPEDGQNVTASADYRQVTGKHTITYNLAGFYNHINNEINWDIIEAAPPYYQYFNLERYITFGGNAMLGYRWSGLHLSAAVQLTRYVLDSLDGVNTFKMLSPDFVAVAGYMIPKALIGINISYKYNGLKPVFSVNTSLTGTRNAYNMLNVSLSRNFWKDRIQLTVGGKNLLGITNVLASNLGGVGHNLGGDDVNIGWGRTVFVSLVLNYSRL
jgi:outer membrane receptor for ferrienterochelin and colicins